MDELADTCRSLPDVWRKVAGEQLEAGETVLAWFEPDLDSRLHFARELILVTDRRILSASNRAESPDTPPDEQTNVWQSWPLETVARLDCMPPGGRWRPGIAFRPGAFGPLALHAGPFGECQPVGPAICGMAARDVRRKVGNRRPREGRGNGLPDLRFRNPGRDRPLSPLFGRRQSATANGGAGAACCSSPGRGVQHCRLVLV